ncbi:sex hormone-binding globulin-like isoform X2 [Engraulis encrasicolus]|uniref:sex hormone-binding globulin-like isoform X2 n=1 Tax=Engraulis encrasicolus TaxID=184585 RepID=UPI002FD2CABD
MGLTWVALGMVQLVVMLCVSPGSLVVDAATEKIDAGGLINLSNREQTWAPYMTLSAPFSEIESITSHFLFRTYDPEGLVFYGDSNDGKDWFVLSLRGGIPEMQFGKSTMMVTVSGGPKLNNGVWHKLELYSEGEFVVLKVDNKPELRVGMHQDNPGPSREGFIRLALGGLLIDQKKLLIPINPLLDACIRDGHWLSLSTPWDITPKKKEMPCSPDIKPGSFFSGGGLVVFNTSAFAFDSLNEINITVLASSDKWNGTILSMWSYHTNSRIVSVGEDAENERLYFKVDVGDMAMTGYGDKDFKSFQMTIEKDSITIESRLQQHVTQRGRIPVNGILEQWKEGMPLSFGGLLGKGGDHDGSAYMGGCLDGIFIQGQQLDLDQAVFKDPSVSSHSCPV